VRLSPIFIFTKKEEIHRNAEVISLIILLATLQNRIIMLMRSTAI